MMYDVCIYNVCFFNLNFKHAALLWSNTICFLCTYYKISVLVQGMS